MNKGFLLIETVMYLALLSFILGGTVVASYSLLDSSERTTKETFIEDDGNFLMARIARAVGDTHAILFPTVNSSGGTLSLDTLLAQLVLFDTLSGQARIKENGFGFVPLTSSNFTVLNMFFVRDLTSEYISVSFDIDKKHFSRIFYLHK